MAPWCPEASYQLLAPKPKSRVRKISHNSDADWKDVVRKQPRPARNGQRLGKYSIWQIKMEAVFPRITHLYLAEHAAYPYVISVMLGKLLLSSLDLVQPKCDG